MESRYDALYRHVLKRMGHLQFDRTDPESRLRQAQEMEELLRNGESVFIFPEGTFSGEDGVRPFQAWRFSKPLWRPAHRSSRCPCRDSQISARWHVLASANQRHHYACAPIYPNKAARHQ